MDSGLATSSRSGITAVDSPVATESVIAVVIAVTVAIVAMVGNTEHALDRTNSAADTGTDGAPDHAAHRAGNPVALIRALLGAAHDALGLA